MYFVSIFRTETECVLALNEAREGINKSQRLLTNVALHLPAGRILGEKLITKVCFKNLWTKF